MATNFPGSLDTSTQQPSPSSTTDLDASGYEHDVDHTNHSGAIIALETKLGSTDSNPTANAVLMGTGSGTSEWDTSPTFKGAVTVGVDDTGHDVKFFGATASSYMLWDESADSLIIAGGDMELPVGKGLKFNRSGTASDILFKETASSTTYATADDDSLINAIIFG